MRIRTAGILGVFGACALLLCGCGNSTPQTATIALPANPTTGYSWEVTQTEELFDVTSEYQQGAAGGEAEARNDEAEARNDEAEAQSGETEMLAGAGGTEVFVLTPKAKGETEVTFAYEREWEDAEPVSSLTYTLKVDWRRKIKVISVTGELDGNMDTVPALPEPEIR